MAQNAPIEDVKKEAAPKDGCCRKLGKCLGVDCCGSNDDILEFGINKNRSCTDLLFCLFFVACLAGLVSIWGVALANGNLDYLLKPLDYTGKVCGGDARTDKPYGVWPSKDHYKFKICAKTCDNTKTNFVLNALQPYDIEQPPYPSTSYKQYCIPNVASMRPDGYDDAAQQANRMIEDLWNSTPIIGGMAGFTIVVGFIYVFLVRKCLGVIVWCAVVAVTCSAGMGGYALYTNASTIEDETTQRAQQVVGGILLAAAVVFVLMSLFLRERIRIAVSVLGVAAKGITALPVLLATPIVAQIFQIGFFILAVYMTAMMFSSATQKDVDTPADILAITTHRNNSYDEKYPATFKRLDYDSAVSNSFWFHIFVCLWVLQYIAYFLYTVVAGAFADWYFSRKDEKGNRKRGNGPDELSNTPVLSAFQRTFWHVGSIAFASLIIAIIQTIRLWFAYMEKQAGKDNCVSKYMFRCIQCALWCLECCMDAINKRALIIIAVKGDPFCSAASKAFKIIWANLVRVAVMSMFTWIVILIGKALVAFIPTAVGCLIYMYTNDEKAGLLAPALAMLVINWLIAGSFMTVYETSADTVFLCFLMDEKVNKGKTPGMFAEKELRDIVDKHSAKSKELAEQTKGRREAARGNGGEPTKKAAKTDGDTLAV